MKTYTQIIRAWGIFFWQLTFWMIALFLLTSAALAQEYTSGWTDERIAKYPKYYDFLLEMEKTHDIFDEEYVNKINYPDIGFKGCKKAYLIDANNLLAHTEVLVNDEEYFTYIVWTYDNPHLIYDLTCNKKLNDMWRTTWMEIQ